MSAELPEVVARIHATDWRAVLAITGGGSGAIAELLAVPGASRTVLEAVVPYSEQALSDWLGSPPEQACSVDTARALALRAYARARELAPAASVLGLGVTSSLASDRRKRGPHRSHLALAGEQGVAVWSLRLEKGARGRRAEEELVAAVAIRLLAEACGVEAASAARGELGSGDRLESETRTQTQARSDGAPVDLVAELADGTRSRVTLLPDGAWLAQAPIPGAVLAGSFDPLHEGHLELARVAGSTLGSEVAFELSIVNVDKPALARREILERVAQFEGRAVLELTRTAHFHEKAQLLPGATFVVGADTAERIIDAKYYEGSERQLHDAFQTIARCGCRFLVAGRAEPGGRFQTLRMLHIPPGFAELFRELPEAEFRVDLTSTELRNSRSR